MNLLWVATKAPWPPVDGGRLLLWHTLRALREAGHALELVAPVWGNARAILDIEGQLGAWCTPRLVRARPRGAASSWLRAALRGSAWTLERHRLPAVARAVAELARAQPPDIAVAEQLQAVAQTEFARRLWVLRAQNVESVLWRAQAACARGPKAASLRRQARRVAAFEANAARRAAGVAALTAIDRVALHRLAGAGVRCAVLPAPFPAELPPGPRAAGDPPLILFGSPGWAPNADQVDWFLRSVWNEVRAASAGAELHVFGYPASAPGVLAHGDLGDSREAFPLNGVMLVPLRVGSGVRMKILEAWARGVPVVASPAAAAGLETSHDEGFLLAETPAEWVSAIRRLADDPALGARLVAGGREVLRRSHQPSQVAARWTAWLEELRGA
jgi:hypothetical protein